MSITLCFFALKNPYWNKLNEGNKGLLTGKLQEIKPAVLNFCFLPLVETVMKQKLLMYLSLIMQLLPTSALKKPIFAKTHFKTYTSERERKIRNRHCF